MDSGTVSVLPVVSAQEQREQHTDTPVSGREQDMDRTDERFLVYTALLVVCSTIGTFLGLAAAAWTFFQVAVVIEVMYWLGSNPGGNDGSRSLEGK